MLDGVFNHTGRKSVYFNADGFYDDLGAAQGEQSPYYRWYNFHPIPRRVRRLVGHQEPARSQ